MKRFGLTLRDVLAVVQAGGAGNRMDVLTRERAKPALPVAGVYQLIDFSLSNLSHSGVTDVWLSVQYLGASLEGQVANGRPWDLDRTRGGLRLVMPAEGTGGSDEDGFARGNADELFRIRDQIRAVRRGGAGRDERRPRLPARLRRPGAGPPGARRRVHGGHDRGRSAATRPTTRC